MDVLAVIFGITLVSAAFAVTYLWGIKPEREQKKRQAEQIRAELRRQQLERFQKQTALRGRSVPNH